MADFTSRVIVLNEAAWRLRRAAPRPAELPFALALFSDEKRTPDILKMAEGLPDGGEPIAVIFRHDGLPADERLRLAGEVRDVVQAKGHLFLMARRPLPGADGVHAGEGEGLRTAPVHDEDEIVRAVMDEVDAAFLSPVYATQSHPGATPLGRSRAVALAQAARVPLLALGGMNERTAASLEGAPFQGFGAIGAFTG
ncbi:thiamine phosphate synthase [Parvularcula maris]|uniref:thiamine phosphate synthase n=1 Tax=Parvularcula maris TaxID=2965077 RepID=UPI002113BF7D